MSRARQLYIVIAYFLFCFILLEVGARITLGTDHLFERLATNDDATWRLRWVKRHQTGMTIYYSFDEFDPIRGWRTKANISNGKTGEAKLTTNSHGLRGANEYAYQKPDTKTRILILGDSFTFGEEVSDEQTYPYLLEHALANTEVLNLGVHGYGTDQMLLYLKAEGVKYSPDIVVLGFLVEDMDRNLLAFRDYAKPKYELKEGALTLANTPLPSPDTLIRTEPFRPKIIDIVRMYTDKQAWINGDKQHEMERITQVILDEMLTSIQHIGATPVFMYLPTAAESVQTQAQYTSGEKFLLDYCKKRHVICTSMRPAFTLARNHGQALKSYGHWDGAEHALVAEGIANFLKQQAIVK